MIHARALSAVSKRLVQFPSRSGRFLLLLLLFTEREVLLLQRQSNESCGDLFQVLVAYDAFLEVVLERAKDGAVNSRVSLLVDGE
jgi:hypothetical protein